MLRFISHDVAGTGQCMVNLTNLKKKVIGLLNYLLIFYNKYVHEFQESKSQSLSGMCFYTLCKFWLEHGQYNLVILKILLNPLDVSISSDLISVVAIDKRYKGEEYHS